MSYRCHQCHRVIGPGVAQMKRIVEKRPTEKGWEIKREIKTCLECKSRSSPASPEGDAGDSGDKSPSRDKDRSEGK